MNGGHNSTAIDNGNLVIISTLCECFCNNADNTSLECSLFLQELGHDHPRDSDLMEVQAQKSAEVRKRVCMLYNRG